MSHSEQNIREDDAVQIAVRNLFLGSAPERENELEQFWIQYFLKIQMTNDIHEGSRIIMDAGQYRVIRFNHRTVRAFWLGSYIAWEGYRAVAESPTLDAVNLTHFSSMLVSFEKMIASDHPEKVPLPDGVLEPGMYPDRTIEPQSCAAGELATFATAWALLHEVRHIRHQREGTSANLEDDDPSTRHAEELSCDAFATTFLLDRLNNYADEKGVDPNQVRQKRQLGIYFALFVLTLLTKEKWEASRCHPSVRDRLKAVRAIMASQVSESAAALSHTAFAALQALWPNAPSPFWD